MHCSASSLSSGIDTLGSIESVHIKKGVEESRLIPSYTLKGLKIKRCTEPLRKIRSLHSTPARRLKDIQRHLIMLPLVNGDFEFGF